MSDTIRKVRVEGDEGDSFVEFFRIKKETNVVFSLQDHSQLFPLKEETHNPFILLPITGVLPASRFLTVLDGGDGWGIVIGHRPPEDRMDSGDRKMCPGDCSGKGPVI